MFAACDQTDHEACRRHTTVLSPWKPSTALRPTQSGPVLDGYDEQVMAAPRDCLGETGFATPVSTGPETTASHSFARLMDILEEGRISKPGPSVELHQARLQRRRSHQPSNTPSQDWSRYSSDIEYMYLRISQVLGWPKAGCIVLLLPFGGDDRHPFVHCKQLARFHVWEVSANHFVLS